MTLNAFVSSAPVLRSTSFAPAALCHQSRRPTSPAPAVPAKWSMGKNAKFGPFTPAVLAAKLILGEKQLNKIRGKSIKLHSQAIAEYCKATGADSKTRMSLI